MSLSDVRRFKLGQAGSIDAAAPRSGLRLTNWIKRTEYPKLVGAHTTDGSASTTAHNANVGSPAAGQMVLLAIRGTVNATISVAGFTQLFTNTENDRASLFYKVCDGTEGATVAVTFGSASRMAAIALRYSGAGVPIFSQCIRSNTTGLTQPNDMLHGGWGIKDNCFVVFDTYEGGSLFSTRPSGYSSAADESGTITNTGSAGAGLSTIHWTIKFARASRDDPGSWTTTGAVVWTTFGVMVPPG